MTMKKSSSDLSTDHEIVEKMFPIADTEIINSCAG
jgi:hypothetical protein